jgi:hypothetical protein
MQLPPRICDFLTVFLPRVLGTFLFVGRFHVIEKHCSEWIERCQDLIVEEGTRYVPIGTRIPDTN